MEESGEKLLGLLGSRYLLHFPFVPSLLIFSGFRSFWENLSLPLLHHNLNLPIKLMDE